MPDDQMNDNVYLLPQTVDFYQQELTRMLEFERYEEAVRLLRFVIGCEGVELPKEEWQALLDWLVTMFPETDGWAYESPQEETTEEDLLRTHFKQKLEQDPSYVDKLLSVFNQNDAVDKQFLALEQLRYLEHPAINSVLKEWLDGRTLPPSLQFKAMQMLKRRGVEGTIRMVKSGKAFAAELSDVPASRDEMPLPMQEILQRVLRTSENSAPNLAPFAEQTWDEFVAYAYGTPVYHSLLVESPDHWDAWAGAFHHMLLKTALGCSDEGELREMYGITKELEPAWEKAEELFHDFAMRMFPAFAAKKSPDSE